MNSIPQPVNMGGTHGMNGIADIMKTQMLSMMMFQSASGNNQNSNPFSAIWGILALTIVENIMSCFPLIINFIKKQTENYLKKNKELIEEKLKLVNDNNPVVKKIITASITIEINIAGGEDATGIALLDFITNHPNTKSVLLVNKNYILNYKETILLNEYQEIYAILKSNKQSTENNNETSTVKGNNTIQTIELYTYKITMDELRNFINNIVSDHRQKMQNKLGNKLYFFNEIPVPAFEQVDGVKDYSRLPPMLTFTIKPFFTNRKFSNIFGHEAELIKKRVNFFKNNRQWYDDKGIPYTLGLLLSGQAGAGKTSTIKCIANETKRHIININLHGDLTKTQIDNLFFDEFITINVNGKLEQVNIPIDKRLYVLEDIDCQNDLVMERADKNKESENEKVNNSDDSKKPSVNIQTNPKKGQPIGDSSNKLTLSFLLNLLDGVLETPGRILIMTSNFPKKLDHALIRPGRIDLIADFKKCVNDTIICFYEHFYDIKLTEDEVSIINGLEEFQWSPAEITKILFENFNDYLQAIEKMVEYNKTFLNNKELEKKKKEKENEESYNFIAIAETIEPGVSSNVFLLEEKVEEEKEKEKETKLQEYKTPEQDLTIDVHTPEFEKKKTEYFKNQMLKKEKEFLSLKNPFGKLSIEDGKIDIDEKKIHDDRRELIDNYGITPFDESKIFSSNAQFAVYG